MTRNVGHALLFSLGAAFAGAAPAQTQVWVPGQGVVTHPSANPQPVQQAPQFLRRDQQPGQIQPPPAGIYAPQQSPQLHPDYEAALINEARRRGGDFDPASLCAAQLNKEYARATGQPQPPDVRPLVEGQVNRYLKGQGHILAQKGGIGREILGNRGISEVQVNQQQSAGIQRTCGMMAANNSQAWGGLLPRVMQGGVIPVVNTAEVNGLIGPTGRTQVPDAMRNRANDRATDAATDALIRRLPPSPFR